MQIFFISMSLLLLLINCFSFLLTYLKANLDKNITLAKKLILNKKAKNYKISLFYSFTVLWIVCMYDNDIVCLILILLIISMYMFVLLYNTKWNNYKLEMAEYVLRVCINFEEEDFVKFKEDMSREDQINWLKSLLWVGKKGTDITTEGNIPLIENDEELEDFNCFLKEEIKNQ